MSLAAVVISAAGNAVLASDEINEGELTFLTEAPDTTPHHHSKHIVVTAESLETGWTRSNQCHYHLDQVPAMEVVFRKGRVRGLKVLESQNIGRVWVEDDSVQMENVGENAYVCIASENYTFRRDPKRNVYLLVSGPYMRRFLDGYFPMRVDLTVDYPSDLLNFEVVSPNGLRPHVSSSPGQVRVDAVFEGQLIIGLGFSGKKTALEQSAPP